MQGLPASGKSTKAKEILQQGNTVRINKDLLRTMLHFDKFTGVNESMTRSAARTIARMFLADGKNVVIDDTNLNPGTVQSWVDLAKEMEAKIQYERMNTPIEECSARDLVRKKSVGRHVIIQMALQYLDYMKGQKVVICDLDGTLCDITHRLHFVRNLSEGQKKDWGAFFRAIPQDAVRADVLDKLLKYEAEGNKIILVSARPDNYREQTEAWLEYAFKGYNLAHVLIMRNAGDRRDDTIVKAELYDKYLKDLSITKVIDDRPAVIRMWREKGLDVDDVGQGVEF